MQKIGTHLTHHNDRPEVELRILALLRGANGPTTAGIAREMGLDAGAAAVHLRALSDANRIWGQFTHGQEMSWHISLAGRHFLDEHRPIAA